MPPVQRASGDTRRQSLSRPPAAAIHGRHVRLAGAAGPRRWLTGRLAGTAPIYDGQLADAPDNNLPIGANCWEFSLNGAGRLTTTMPVTDGRWYDVAATYDPGSGPTGTLPLGGAHPAT